MRCSFKPISHLSSIKRIATVALILRARSQRITIYSVHLSYNERFLATCHQQHVFPFSCFFSLLIPFALRILRLVLTSNSTAKFHSYSTMILNHYSTRTLLQTFFLQHWKFLILNHIIFTYLLVSILQKSVVADFDIHKVTHFNMSFQNSSMHRPFFQI